MNIPLEKFARFVSAVEAEKGPFILVGLFQRLDALDLWDLVCAAAWLDDSRLDGMRYLAQKLGEVLDPKEMLILSRIVPMEAGDASVIRISDLTAGLQKPLEMTNLVFADTRVNAAYILASKRPGIVVPRRGLTTRL